MDDRERRLLEWTEVIDRGGPCPTCGAEWKGSTSSTVKLMTHAEDCEYMLQSEQQMKDEDV